MLFMYIVLVHSFYVEAADTNPLREHPSLYSVYCLLLNAIALHIPDSV